MKRVALVTDAQTPLGEELIRRYLAHGYCVAATRSNQARIETPLVSEDEAFLLIDWNRKSPISTKNVVLTTLNRFDRIDHTLLLLAPELEKKLLQEITTETIDRAVDTWIKGTLFMTKAVLEHYCEKQEGRLALINHIQQEAGTVLPPLESALRGSFTAVAEVLFASNSQQNVFINGIESRSGTVQEFADFVFATMTERAGRVSGKWLRFSSRRGLFTAPLAGRLLGRSRLGRPRR